MYNIDNVRNERKQERLIRKNKQTLQKLEVGDDDTEKKHQFTCSFEEKKKRDNKEEEEGGGSGVLYRVLRTAR